LSRQLNSKQKYLYPTAFSFTYDTTFTEISQNCFVTKDYIRENKRFIANIDYLQTAYSLSKILFTNSIKQLVV